MRVSINIPSYKRPKVKTLDYLPYCKVWVDSREADAYREANPGAEIVVCDEGVQGNVSRVRNHILNREFASGADAVLILDDDMSGVYVWDGPKVRPYERRKLDKDEFLLFVEKYSEMCRDWGFKMWGCNCNQDFQSYRQIAPFSTSAFLGGPFQCFLNNPLRYDERLSLKEDYDMTIQQCNKYRGVLRLNFAFYICKQSKQEGGCASYRNRQRESEQLDMLEKKWGGRIVKRDKTDRNHKSNKQREWEDYNPIINIPIKGI